MSVSVDNTQILAEKRASLLKRAEELRKYPGVARRAGVTDLLAQNLVYRSVSDKEIFEAAYGEPGGASYWAAFLSEPRPASALAYHLALHIAPGADRIGIWKKAVLQKIRIALEAKENWFIGNAVSLAPSLTENDDLEPFDRLKLHPRLAAEWLMRMPECDHLLPDSLKAFLSSEVISTAPAALDTRTTVGSTEASENRPATADQVEALALKQPPGRPKGPWGRDIKPAFEERLKAGEEHTASEWLEDLLRGFIANHPKMLASDVKRLATSMKKRIPETIREYCAKTRHK